MKPILVLAAVFLFAGISLWAQQTGSALSRGGYSVFDGTMADMTYQEVEQAARDHSVVLWPLGVIEEHGPHLPLGTDIYNSYLRMKRVAETMRAGGTKVVIAPPLYWGINEATGAFGGSFTLRPSTLKAIIEDTFHSFRKDGFQNVYIITGHNDRLHNKTIVDGVEEARVTTGVRAFVVMTNAMRDRLGLTGSEPHILVQDAGPAPIGGAAATPRPPTNQTGAPAGAQPTQIDVHAGNGETAITSNFFPSLVKADMIKGLKPTNYGPADLTEWRKGWQNARNKTPLGYFGDPASAVPERGAAGFERDAAQTAAAIETHLKSGAAAQ